MRILNILKNKKYLALAVISALVMLVAYPLIQTYVSGGINVIDLWFTVTKPINLVLYALFSILFGLFLTLHIYNLRQKVCSIKEKRTSASSGGIGTILAVLVPQCPACLSLVALFLPAATAVSVAGFLSKYNTLLLILSTTLLILGIYLLKGFEKV
ncbi:MAG: hypothetical protein AABX59_00955 [Nanoarchaeota archaeon]